MEKAKLGTRRANALFEVPVRYTRTFRYPKVTYLPFDWDYPPKKDYIDLSGDRTMDIGFTKDVLKRPKLPFSRLPEIDEWVLLVSVAATHSQQLLIDKDTDTYASYKPKICLELYVRYYYHCY